MPKDRLLLRFRASAVIAHVDDPIHHDLSAAARAGDSLFLCCDETAGDDRLTEADGHWGNPRQCSLGTRIDLPDGPCGSTGSAATTSMSCPCEAWGCAT